MLAGIPQGINTLANQNALFRRRPVPDGTRRSGLLRTFQYLGAILSSAAIAIVFKTGAHTSGLHQLALLMLVCGGLLLIAVLADRSLSQEHVEAEEPPRSGSSFTHRVRAARAVPALPRAPTVRSRIDTTICQDSALDSDWTKGGAVSCSQRQKSTVISRR